MRLRRSIILFAIIFIPVVIFSMVMGKTFIYALDVVVSATVPSQPPPEAADTIVIFRGLAYPGSDVTIRQDGTVLATIKADPQARFDVSVTIDPGIYTFSIFGEDVQGRVGRISNFTLSITQGTTTTISGIFLGPTIATDKTQINVGDTITVLGATAPQSEVNVFIGSPDEVVHKVTADDSGLWSKSLIADDTLPVGSHTARSKAVAIDQSISEFSQTVAFEVQTPGQPDPCSQSKPGDLNCDGSVNLIDFSILLYNWNSTNPANSRADINKDGTVNVVDFSILLYYWTG